MRCSLFHRHFGRDFFDFFPLNFTSTGLFSEGILFLTLDGSLFLPFVEDEGSLVGDFFEPLSQLLKPQGAVKRDSSLGCLSFLRSDWFEAKP